MTLRGEGFFSSAWVKLSRIDLSSISWRILSLLMSRWMSISAMLLHKATQICLTGMDKLAFSVQIVKGKKNLHQSSFE